MAKASASLKTNLKRIYLLPELSTLSTYAYCAPVEHTVTPADRTGTRTPLGFPALRFLPVKNCSRVGNVHLWSIKNTLPGAFRMDLSCLARHSRVKFGQKLCAEALSDAEKVIELSPSSCLGYELKHTALRGAQRYDDAFKVFAIMLSKLDDAPDPDTTRLCNRDMQINAFTEITEYKELFHSLDMHRPLQREPIKEAVAKYFSWGRDIYDLNPVGTVVKLQKSCKVVRDAGQRCAWSDTCCIDQNNNVEVQQSVNSMFEFLAPKVVLFYQADWTPCLDDRSRNHEESVSIMKGLKDATGINASALVDFHPGTKDAREKLRWASTRVTTLQEDIAYSLFGIFGIHLHLIRATSRPWTGWDNRPTSTVACQPDISSYKAPTCTLPYLSEDEMQMSVSMLQNSIVAVEWASRLYTLLENLSVTQFANARLQLPCIAFPLTEVRRSAGGDGDKCFTYEVKAHGPQDLQVTTEDRLVQFSPARRTRQSFLLVHPRNRDDLGLINFANETQHVEDWPESESPGYNEPTTRELRLIVRLGQPFGGLLASAAVGWGV
ncbi:hypothetical protein EV424DRAFT_1540391 [Suillus variegatus]|nr:hypothetical protein EV424DRAFT_1540391 [Suillus variegatus]